MESLSAIERRVGPLGSHARGYTHKITKALNHLDALASRQEAQPASEPFQKALEIRIAQGFQLGGNACPVLYTDSINGEQVSRDDLWIATTAGLKGSDAATPSEALSPATVAQPVALYADNTPSLHVGDSAFEDWYQNYLPNSVGHKQIARDAYAAGMGDPLVIARDAAQPCASQGCGGAEVHVEALARVVNRGDGLVLDWLIEGGISATVEGTVLIVADAPITDDDGAGTVYRRSSDLARKGGAS